MSQASCRELGTWLLGESVGLRGKGECGDTITAKSSSLRLWKEADKEA